MGLRSMKSSPHWYHVNSSNSLATRKQKIKSTDPYRQKIFLKKYVGPQAGEAYTIKRSCFNHLLNHPPHTPHPKPRDS